MLRNNNVIITLKGHFDSIVTFYCDILCPGRHTTTRVKFDVWDDIVSLNVTINACNVIYL